LNLIFTRRHRLQFAVLKGDSSLACLQSLCILFTNLTNLYLRRLKTLSPDLISDIRNLLIERTKAKRIPHVMGVEGMSIVLAQRWGVNLQKTLCSALLHDLAKCLTLEEQREKLEKCTVQPATEEDFDFKNVWHGKVAAQEGYDLFGIDDEDILQAVAHHSTGTHGMSDPGLVLFVADFIEPSRKWDGVEQCRREILDLPMVPAAKKVAELKLEHIDNKNQTAHSQTHVMVNYLNNHDELANSKSAN